MKKTFLFLPLLVLAMSLFTSCEEVAEATKYDNWRERNEAFADSLHALVGDNYVSTIEAADQMQVGKIYAIEIPSVSTTTAKQYVYCKKLVANSEGERPNYTGYHSSVSSYYYGTLITGDRFDGNFTGYSALDQVIPVEPTRVPSDFDSPTTFKLTKVIPGWTWPMQYMRVGERWMLYIPWESGYGSSGSNSILGYSALTFDVVLDGVE